MYAGTYESDAPERGPGSVRPRLLHQWASEILCVYVCVCVRVRGYVLLLLLLLLLLSLLLSLVLSLLLLLSLSLFRGRELFFSLSLVLSRTHARSL